MIVPRVESVEKYVIYYYAGLAADIQLSPETEAIARLQAESDTEQAEIGLRMIGCDTDADRTRLRVRTVFLVHEHWSEIARVARELLECEELDATEADTCCEIAMGEAAEDDLMQYRALRG